MFTLSAQAFTVGMQAVFNFQDKKLLSVVVKVCKTLFIVSEGILLVLILHSDSLICIMLEQK